MKKAALIEFNTYHDECLYSQIEFLKASGYAVNLVVNKKIQNRASEYLHLAEDVTIIQPSSQKNFFRRIALIFKLKKHLQKSNITTVIFNTASSRLEVILLSFLLKKDADLYGILHNLKKVNHSFSQKLINKSIKNYFVLNDFLEDSIQLEDNSIQLRSFYPIFFPDYKATSLKKTKGEVWISIPGKLDFGRRDYFLVAEALEKAQIKSNLKIIILGSTNPDEPINKEFLDYIQTHDLQNNFVTFDSFLENDTFHDYIKKSDYILIPLDSVGNNYSRYKIMGCYNQAFGYKKNLISPIGLMHIPDIESHSILYNGMEELSKVFENLSNGEIDKKEYLSNKWSFEEQRNRYVSFLESK